MITHKGCAGQWLMASSRMETFSDFVPPLDTKVAPSCSCSPPLLTSVYARRVARSDQMLVWLLPLHNRCRSMSITTLLLRWRQPSLSQERAEREQYLCVELVCLLPFIALNDGADGCEVQVLNEEGLWADGQVRQKFLHVCVPQVLEDGIANTNAAEANTSSASHAWSDGVALQWTILCKMFAEHHHAVLECQEHLGASTASWLLVVRMFEMHDWTC